MVSWTGRYGGSDKLVKELLECSGGSEMGVGHARYTDHFSSNWVYSLLNRYLLLLSVSTHSRGYQAIRGYSASLAPSTIFPYIQYPEVVPIHYHSELAPLTSSGDIALHASRGIYASLFAHRFYPIATLHPISIGASTRAIKSSGTYRGRTNSRTMSHPHRKSCGINLVSRRVLDRRYKLRHQSYSRPCRNHRVRLELSKAPSSIPIFTEPITSAPAPSSRQIPQSHWRHPEGSSVIQIHRSGAFFLGTSIFGLMHAYAQKLIIFMSIFGRIACRRPTLPLKSYTLLDSMATYVWCYMANLISPPVLIFPRTMSRTTLDRLNTSLARTAQLVRMQDTVLTAPLEELVRDTAPLIRNFTQQQLRSPCSLVPIWTNTPGGPVITTTRILQNSRVRIGNSASQGSRRYAEKGD
ncbi:hypothetical protein FB451DRAFT_1172763 [Mycena latifolia]|nr:hypothetical protein FB451DRAFT_1172763 [Mycena latifolia]